MNSAEVSTKPAGMDNEKHYSRREEFFNWLSHAAGAAAALGAGIPVLLKRLNGIQAAAALIYMLSMALLFSASAVYHILPDGSRARRIARKCDHCSIFILIAGTYTALLPLTSAEPALPVTLVWATGITGIICELLDFRPFPHAQVLLYVLMGWLCVFFRGQIFGGIPDGNPAGKLLIAGGIVYTSGVFFYVCRKAGCHAVWHLFVLGGAVLHYLAIFFLA